MDDLWLSLPVGAQDALVSLGLLLPGLLLGVLVVRGFQPWPLVRAMLGRFRGANAIFVLLIAAAVALGAGLTAQERALRQGSARAAERFDLVLGAPGSEISLVLAAVYLQPMDLPLLSGEVFAEVAADPEVDLAAPIAFGDSWNGAPVVGTTAGFVTHLAGDLAMGRMFADHGEAVAGAFAPVGMGDAVEPAHGQGEVAEHDAHGGTAYVVVGRMAPTGSPWDRAILVPVEAVWEVHALPTGHAPERAEQIGPPFDPEWFPGTPAILVRADEVWANYALRDRYTRADVMAVFPGSVLASLHGLLRDMREAMSLMALVTQGLVVVAVLAGLSLLVRVFARGLALLRALGAPRRFVLAVVWSYAASLVGFGASLGLALGWMVAAVLSGLVTARTDVLVQARIGWTEVQLVTGFMSLALLLALLPSILASRRSPLNDLRA
ncbi:ABC transporter permease [Rubellimicrobium rubrum]|uniref:ABC transporter permease n=1 Tax=Rubellimicrobium rubrum TaxID=2585369 RepID=A0A5C4MWY0_9RHOB|nr:ABC transporter permease [Rubellimicrobium rubrum]TNC49905.1 ABC transporter permease [Rubellimicrobium rubrum]